MARVSSILGRIGRVRGRFTCGLAATSERYSGGEQTVTGGSSTADHCLPRPGFYCLRRHHEKRPPPPMPACSFRPRRAAPPSLRGAQAARLRRAPAQRRGSPVGSHERRWAVRCASIRRARAGAPDGHTSWTWSEVDNCRHSAVHIGVEMWCTSSMTTKATSARREPSAPARRRACTAADLALAPSAAARRRRRASHECIRGFSASAPPARRRPCLRRPIRCTGCSEDLDGHDHHRGVRIGGGVAGREANTKSPRKSRRSEAFGSSALSGVVYGKRFPRRARRRVPSAIIVFPQPVGATDHRWRSSPVTASKASRWKAWGAYGAGAVAAVVAPPRVRGARRRRPVGRQCCLPSRSLVTTLPPPMLTRRLPRAADAGASSARSVRARGAAWRPVARSHHACPVHHGTPPATNARTPLLRRLFPLSLHARARARA